MFSREQLWNKLNTHLANRCSDGEITEEQMESVLDKAEPLDVGDLEVICWEQGIEICDDCDGDVAQW